MCAIKRVGQPLAGNLPGGRERDPGNVSRVYTSPSAPAKVQGMGGSIAEESSRRAPGPSLPGVGCFPGCPAPTPLSLASYPPLCPPGP